jgi:type IV fimbrial biogenesis protein FimT
MVAMRRRFSVRSCVAARLPARHGFTLIEFLIVLVIVTVLAGLAAPGMRQFIEASRVGGAASDLHYSLMSARSLAISQNSQAEVAPVGDSWTNGWTTSVNGTVVERHDPIPSVAVLPAVPVNIAYRMNGRLASGAQTIVLSSSASGLQVHPRCLVIDASGKPSVKTDTDYDPANQCG